MSYPYEFALHAETNRNRVYDAVLSALEQASSEHGTTQSQIANLIGRKPSQVSAWLSGPSNWTLDTVSDLLRAVGASMRYAVVFDTDQVSSNVKHPALFEPAAASMPVETGSPLQEAPIIEGTMTWQIRPQQTNLVLNPPQIVLGPLYGSGISNTVIYTPTRT